MPTASSLARSLYVVYREASRSPWICLSELTHLGEPDPAAVQGGPPLLLLGGFLSHPVYYAPLGRVLAARGYAVHFDDVVNARPLIEHVRRLVERLETLAAEHRAPVRLVGHSLGGIQALLLLLARPDLVHQVVAVGSPVQGGTPVRALQRLVERVLKIRAREAARFCPGLAPYARRVTTIASPHDLVAPPETCALDGATNVVLGDVPATDRPLLSHTGLVFMRSVVEAMLDALGRPSLAAPLAAVG